MSGQRIAPRGGCETSETLDRLVTWIHNKGLRAPAILFLKFHEPLAPLGSQALLLFQPLLEPLGTVLGWTDGERMISECASLLEDPTGVERLLARLEGDTAGPGGG